jgi:hypothetical protein
MHVLFMAQPSRSKLFAYRQQLRGGVLVQVFEVSPFQVDTVDSVAAFLAKRNPPHLLRRIRRAFITEEVLFTAKTLRGDREFKKRILIVILDLQGKPRMQPYFKLYTTEMWCSR